jgi:GAF domain-containing protein
MLDPPPAGTPPPLTVLVRVHSILSNARIAEEAFYNLIGAVWSKIGFVAGRLLVRDATGRRLHCRAGWPGSSTDCATPHSPADYYSGESDLKDFVWHRRQVKWLTRHVVQDGLTHTELLVCVPLVADGRIVGVLDLVREGAREPSADEAALLSKLGRRFGEFLLRIGV